jgi:hypothetical protein
MSSRLLFAPLALGLLAGCQSTNPAMREADPAIGEAVKYNAAMQTIDPDPVYPENGAQPGDHGEKAANAVERYRKDQVKQVETMKTSTISIGSSTGSGSGPQ